LLRIIFLKLTVSLQKFRIKNEEHFSLLFPLPCSPLYQNKSGFLSIDFYFS
jgi:hypothetical protein